jgi:hypothetical protein
VVRSVAVLAALAALLPAVGGCGTGDGGGGGTGKAGDALSYLPRDADLVGFVSTDFESEAVQELDRQAGRSIFGGGIEEALREAAESVGLSFEDDVQPLLGNDLVVVMTAGGFAGEDDVEFVLALDTDNAEKLAEVAAQFPGAREGGEVDGATVYEGQEGTSFAVDGDVFVLAESRAGLEAALARSGGEHLTEDDVGEALSDLPTDGPIRGYANVAAFFEVDEVAEEAGGLRELPWFAAARTLGVAVDVEDDELLVDFAVTTDADRVDEDDLPLATGEESPEIVPSETEISGANRDQSRTTVFLLRAARAAFPESRFVQEVQEVESELGIDFEEEILGQFDGPSASLVSSDGDVFAARSQVRDPDALRETIRELEPHLPALVEGLQGLQSTGLAALFLLAPDAPVATQELTDVQVTPPSEPDGFYRVSGLTGAGPSEMVFGLVGDVFVVASDEERALRIAEADTTAVEGAEGAGVLRADLGSLLAGVDGEEFAPGLGELVASLEASEERLRGRVRVELR